MNADSFMHLLGVALIAGLGGYYGLRYLKARLDVGPARVYHPLDVVPYFREAWEIFPRFKMIGWLLTAAALVPTIVAIVVIKNNITAFNYLESLNRTDPSSTSLDRLFLDFLINVPKNIHTTSNVLTRALTSAGEMPFVALLAYLTVRLTREEKEGISKKAARVSGYVIMAATMQVAVLVLAALFPNDDYLLKVSAASFASSWMMALNSISYIFMLLGATVAEAIFLRIVFEAIRGNKMSARDAFGSSVDCFRPLFIFNLIYFGLPFVLSWVVTIFWTLGMYFPIELNLPSSQNDYIDGFIWLLRMLFFLTPFFIVYNGLDLKSALKKNISIVFKAPVDYFALMFTVILSILLVSFAFGIISAFVVKPVSHSFILMQITEYLFGVFYIWFSLFAACVFAIFSKQRFLNQPE